MPLDTKGGAEGCQGLGVRTPDGRAVGLALRVDDGHARARGPVLVELPEVLGLTDAATTLERLEPPRRPPVVSYGARRSGRSERCSS